MSCMDMDIPLQLDEHVDLWYRVRVAKSFPLTQYATDSLNIGLTPCSLKRSPPAYEKEQRTILTK